jgi:hypothetical protein
VILVAMLFTSTVTPYEVCLLWGEPAFDALFYINLLVNTIFVVDTTMQFFLPYKESVTNGGGTVKNHKKIAWHYLSTWFFIDIISVIPFDYIVLGVTDQAASADETLAESQSLLGATSMLRLLRLIKLVRILRASRIFARWENSISIKYSTRELFSLLGGVALTLHLLSCALGMAAQLMRVKRSEQLLDAVAARIEEDDTMCYGCIRDDAQYGPACELACYTPCEVEILAEQSAMSSSADALEAAINFIRAQESWICRQVTAGTIRAMPEYHGQAYVAGLYVAMLQMSGGVGSIVPQNLPE